MAMLRSVATRSLLRSIATTPAPIRQQFRSQLCTLSARSHVQTFTPKTLALTRWASTSRGSQERNVIGDIDPQAESEIAKEKLHAHPELVSATSSTHGLMSEVGAGSGERGHPEEADTDMLVGVKNDLVRPINALTLLYSAVSA